MQIGSLQAEDWLCKVQSQEVSQMQHVKLKQFSYITQWKVKHILYSLINPHSTIVLIYILSVSNKSVDHKSPKSVHHLKFTSWQFQLNLSYTVHGMKCRVQSNGHKKSTLILLTGTLSKYIMTRGHCSWPLNPNLITRWEKRLWSQVIHVFITPFKPICDGLLGWYMCMYQALAKKKHHKMHTHKKMWPGLIFLLPLRWLVFQYMAWSQWWTDGRIVCVSRWMYIDVGKLGFWTTKWK